MLVASLLAGQAALNYGELIITRTQIFNPEFTHSKYGEEYQVAFGNDPPIAGYPDDGNGRISDTLAYPDWLL